MKIRRGDSADYTLSQNQVKALLAACHDLEDRITVSAPLFLSLRIGELVHMRDDWITQEGLFQIPYQQQCNCAECIRERGGTWKPKTKAGARTLLIPTRMREDLAELFKIKPHGMEISRTGLYYRTKTIFIRANIKFTRTARSTGFPHCLRATCATMLAAGGMSAVHLSYYMGWKSIAIGDHYIRLSTAKAGAIKEAKEIFG